MDKNEQYVRERWKHEVHVFAGQPPTGVVLCIAGSFYFTCESRTQAWQAAYEFTVQREQEAQQVWEKIYYAREQWKHSVQVFADLWSHLLTSLGIRAVNSASAQTRSLAMSIQRYEKDGPEATPNEHGGWVLFRDHEAEVDRLQAENAALKARAEAPIDAALTAAQKEQP